MAKESFNFALQAAMAKTCDDYQRFALKLLSYMSDHLACLDLL